MNLWTRIAVLLSILPFVCLQSVEVWRSTGDSLEKLVQKESIPPSTEERPGVPVINVYRNERDQSIKGFGAAISNSAAYLLYTQVGDKNAALRTLFDAQDGVGLSYIRLVMGGSDFNAVEPYTYDDIDSGDDYEMEQFTIDKDREFVIPILKDILAVNPGIRIMASPWSPPAWMKNPRSLNGGELRPGTQILQALARYFVRFIKAYEEEGIHIDAVTLQNEPDHAASGYPTMLMTWWDQRDIIREYLGPMFQEEGITTEILIWDHNWDNTNYALDILADGEARQYIAGSAWHCYGGDRFDPLEVRNAYPDKDLYFTECSGGEWDNHFGSTLGWNVQNLLIGQTRIGSRSVLMWNMALDENHGPRVGVTGGCSDCRGVITVLNSGQIELNVEYYSLGHFSKFVRPGAVYINSDSYESNNLESAAYENDDDGSVVVVILNAGWDAETKTFQVQIDGNYYYYENLPSRSVLTFIRR